MFVDPAELNCGRRLIPDGRFFFGPRSLEYPIDDYFDEYVEQAIEMRIETHDLSLSRVLGCRSSAPAAHPLLVDLPHSLGRVAPKEACAVGESDALEEFSVGVIAYGSLMAPRFGRDLAYRPIEILLHDYCSGPVERLDCKSQLRSRHVQPE
jgi:hypothetical protein